MLAILVYKQKTNKNYISLKNNGKSTSKGKQAPINNCTIIYIGYIYNKIEVLH